jgi:hypothetical protein
MPVRGEFINHVAIGVWYNPRQCFCQRYEAKLIGDAGLPESGRRPSNCVCRKSEPRQGVCLERRLGLAVRHGVAGRTEGRLSVTVTRQSRGVCLWQAFG